jgi:hypothetical protein
MVLLRAFLLAGTGSRPRQPPLVWLAEGCRQHTLPYLWEQRSQHGRVTHIAYVVTHIA